VTAHLHPCPRAAHLEAEANRLRRLIAECDAQIAEQQVTVETNHGKMLRLATARSRLERGLP
jgi:uncharacterized coiled-coil protein SlyX